MAPDPPLPIYDGITDGPFDIRRTTRYHERWTDDLTNADRQTNKNLHRNGHSETKMKQDHTVQTGHQTDDRKDNRKREGLPDIDQHFNHNARSKTGHLLT